jgi:glycosyltransferase involved in cell wall biosynthesis
MKKIKILYISDRGYIQGGVEVVLLAQANDMKSKGHEVRMFTGDYNPANLPLFSDFTFKVFDFDGFHKKTFINWLNQIFNIRSYFGLRKILKTFKPDVIHLHSILYQVSPSILTAASNIPIVYTLHDYGLICPTGAIVRPDGSRCVTPGKHDLRCTGSIKGYAYESVKQYIHKFLLKKVSLYITPSESMKRDFTGQKIIQAPIKAIYNGVALFEYRPFQNYNRILFVGRLSKEKGAETLIRAFKIIKDSLHDVRLDIVGDGPELFNLKTLCGKLGLEEYVQFHGHIDKKNIEDYYIKSTIAVVPSICPETFSMAGVEALSVGRPVVGSDIGAIPEWLVDNKCGFLFTPGDAGSLSFKILALLKDRRLLKEMSEFGSNYSRKFSVDANTNSLEDLYFGLINKKNE